MAMPDRATWRIFFEAGLTTRGAVVSELRKASVTYGVQVSIDDDKHLLWSDYILTATGPVLAVRRYSEAVMEFFRVNESGDGDATLG